MSQSTLSPRQRRFILATQRLIYWLSKHWLALVNLFLLLYVSLPFAAPVLMKAGWTRPAGVIYGMYKPLCHQMSFRSWFLFGEQAVYPRAEYEERFDLHGVEWSVLFSHARDYRGDERMGYKVALCQRDIAIQGAMVLGGLGYAFLRRRGLRAMPFWLFILGGVLPMGLDGGSQFVSLVVPSLPARESVWQLRALTGALFGFATVWLAYPYIQEGMDETREILATRYGWNGGTEPPPPPPPTTHDGIVQLLEDRDVI
jgi:uncharacterized membrane protein